MTEGKVYEIVCNETGERYVGSTILRMCLRKALHKQKYNGCSSRPIIDRNNFTINILEENIPEEILRQTEQKWKSQLTCVNIREAYVSPEEQKERCRKYQEEWYKDPENKALKKAKYEENREIVLAKAKVKYEENKDKLLIKRIAYYEANKEKIKTYQAEYRTKQKLKSTFPKVEAKDN